MPLNHPIHQLVNLIEPFRVEKMFKSIADRYLKSYFKVERSWGKYFNDLPSLTPQIRSYQTDQLKILSGIWSLKIL